MKRGTEVGLGLRQIGLNGDPAPLPQRGTALPQIFGHACCGQTAGLIKMQLGTEVGLGSDHSVLDGDPAPSPQRGTAPNFRSMSIVAKRSPILTTAEHLLCLFCVVVFVVFRMNVCFCCVRFSFFGTSQGIALEELFGNDVSCVVGRKTLTQSVIMSLDYRSRSRRFNPQPFHCHTAIP